uniref:pyruvate kinase n=1 Tax=Glaesserella sp. TaxID=2094731 RepID=UPI00359F5B9C
ITQKDTEDIIFGIENDVDFIAASFVRRASDVLAITEILEKHNATHIQIIPKIENQEGLDNIDEILKVSQGLMVARGDLGVEIGDAALVGVQKKLIRRSRRLNRVVITATQMMESMIKKPMPTRAEVMDVANAVLDGTDAVMLSGETANGDYPVETVRSMAEVCLGAETMPSINVSRHRMEDKFTTVDEAVAMSAMYTANHLEGVSAIIALTNSGETAKLMSRISSGLPIYALSRNEKALNRCALYRGVTPVYYDQDSRTIDGAKKALSLLKEQGYLMTGDLVLLTHGSEIKEGGTNTCRILRVE